MNNIKGVCPKCGRQYIRINPNYNPPKCISGRCDGIIEKVAAPEDAPETATERVPHSTDNDTIRPNS